MASDSDVQGSVSSVIRPRRGWGPPGFFSEWPLILSSAPFLKASAPRETIFRCLEAGNSGSADRWVTVIIREILLESVFDKNLRKCQYFFYINIFVRLDIVGWTRFQAMGLLNSMRNKCFERRKIRNLGPENCDGLYMLWIGNIRFPWSAPSPFLGDIPICLFSCDLLLAFDRTITATDQLFHY